MTHRIKPCLQAFFKKYNYKHEVLCVAADGPSSVSFSFVADTVSFTTAHLSAAIDIDRASLCFTYLTSQHFFMAYSFPVFLKSKSMSALQAEPKDGVFTKLDDKETSPSRCLSIFMYTFNSDGKINDIKFLRQPSKDEMARKVWDKHHVPCKQL